MAFATLPTKLDEFMFEIAEPFVTTSNPLTVRPVRVPTDVMLGWAGWETTRATLAFATFPTKLAELRFEIPEPFPLMSDVTIEFMFEIPETLRDVPKTEFRFEIPKTLRVLAPNIIAELANSDVTLRVLTLAVPDTLKVTVFEAVVTRFVRFEDPLTKRFVVVTEFWTTRFARFDEPFTKRFVVVTEF